jgi:hypothetical protein
MSRSMRVVLPLLVGFLVAASTPSLQTPDAGVRLHLGRDFGFYASGQMQGAFTLSVDGVDNPARVDYIIDGQRVVQVTQAPFRYSFSTSAYSPGPHQLQAVVRTTTGMTLRTPVSTYTFLTADEAQRATLRILLPLGGGILLFSLTGILATAVLSGRPRAHRAGQYSAAGGAICPRCARAFSRHFMSLNLVVGKLEHCPHCGAWSVVPAASREALHAAEERAAAAQPAGPAPTNEAELLRRQVDESRFLDEG